jgi:hypothetical protein
LSGSIPYDPSLSLGSVVHPELFAKLSEIAKAQAPIDAAQEALNSLISLKTSLDMTARELLDLGVNTDQVHNESEGVGTKISDAAVHYARTRVSQEKEIQAIKASLGKYHMEVESPVDFMRSRIKPMPLSSDSLRLDAQYFSCDENKQGATNTLASIKSFVAKETSVLGMGVSQQLSTAASSQAANQYQNHDISGTLVLTATCTHKNTELLAPFILDVDKAIRVWNTIYKNETDKIKVDDPMVLNRIFAEEGTAQEKFLHVLSGATYGSCFIGMVHIKRADSTKSNQNMDSVAAAIQEKAHLGLYFSSMNGGFGIDSSFADDIKKLLSTQAIDSHVSVVSTGVIPSIVSNQLALGVKQLAEFDGAKMVEKLATLAEATASEKNSAATAAEAARTGGKMVALQSATIKSVMTGLSAIDDGKNSVLDINSMMGGFQDYLEKATEGKAGAPINFFVKNISRAQLAQMWVAKYYPGKYLAVSGDDSGKAAGGASSSSASDGAPSTSASTDAGQAPTDTPMDTAATAAVPGAASDQATA